MTKSKQVKAVGLLSSGIDSALALKLVKEQGIEITAVNFVLPFSSEKKDYSSLTAEKLGIPLMKACAGDGFIEMVRNPRYGYGSNMNPCVDCRIYLLRGAKQVAEEIGADFVITGDVLGERPMSQHTSALRLEEKEADLKEMVLRPLSAKLLWETIPEREGWVDRECLLAIEGRSRKPQLALAREYGIDTYQAPAGGCLLTIKEFSAKLRELFKYRVDSPTTVKDIEVLKIGRHFPLPASRIIVGRNERENNLLLDMKEDEDYIFEVVDIPGPVAILNGSKDREAIELAASLTARYSDADAEEVLVEYVGGGQSERIAVRPAA
jgi:tRNA U34 2-thiouridine synthase MnmA/TrmU